jgi:hypothetical protein
MQSFSSSRQAFPALHTQFLGTMPPDPVLPLSVPSLSSTEHAVLPSARFRLHTPVNSAPLRGPERKFTPSQDNTLPAISPNLETLREVCAGPQLSSATLPFPWSSIIGAHLRHTHPLSLGSPCPHPLNLTLTLSTPSLNRARTHPPITQPYTRPPPPHSTAQPSPAPQSSLNKKQTYRIPHTYAALYRRGTQRTTQTHPCHPALPRHQTLRAGEQPRDANGSGAVPFCFLLFCVRVVLSCFVLTSPRSLRGRGGERASGWVCPWCWLCWYYH